jgi:hypothetical protein
MWWFDDETDLSYFNVPMQSSTFELYESCSLKFSVEERNRHLARLLLAWVSGNL